MERIYGKSGTTILGKNSHEFFPKESADEHALHDQEVIQTRQAISKEYAISSEDEPGVRHFISTKFPIFNEGDEIQCIGALTADITKQKLTEEALRKAKELAESANNAKSRFLANISHEIRTPLTLVIGMTDLIEGGDLTTKQQRHLQTIRNAGDGLLALINSILDLSKIEAEELELENAAFDVTEVVENTIDVYRASAGEKGLVLQACIGKDVDPIQSGDQYRLQQILANLVGNAIKFSDEGMITVRVEQDHDQNHSRALRFSVTDTGVGIPIDQQERIFEVFTQQDTSTTRNYGGSGLGLTICRQLVKLMAGRIWVESQPNKGSTFYFTAIFQKLGNQQKMILSKEHINEQQSQTLNILIAEDDILIRALVVEFLSSEPYTIDIVSNGQEVINAYKENRPDLILMDIQMPVIDGHTATTEIRKWEINQGIDRIPIIALSANVMKEDIEKSLAYGCDDYVSKPMRKKALLSAIRAFYP